MSAYGCLVSYAFTSFSNRNPLRKTIFVCLVSYAFTSFSNKVRGSKMDLTVWYLMLLHHSQTELGAKNTANESGILCFYIILKLPQYSQMMSPCLVSYAFTSFSNFRISSGGRLSVWYLMLLHHSQTGLLSVYAIFTVWYLMLLHHSQTFFGITAIINQVWYLMLLHHSQTSK